ncbi:hypothetical protein GQX73_g8685 [Xylaria multiplex]|uniref:Altered inheritance of mitochondria protein 21 n=1 Tax=Xylaria multiplex TaxID=323545 RepID=A0A7C8IJ48_9PEZI|nr:hypothetical protein GQX73_g8685 [Xylaria multiplex]
MSSPPVVPPRPARSPEKGDETAPTIPARPAKRFNRSISPNPDRFAPSPLNESPFNSKPKRNSQSFLGEELDRSTAVDMPGVGEEGQEYAAAIEELSSSSPEANRSASPEQTRIVGEDLKLHAPKPTVPAASAKQRVATVTRTDSDRAAAFGIGRPSSEEPLHSGARSLKKKASTASQLSHHSELHTDDEHGIPEIGQRVPMLAYAGDVQAPSPAPPRASSVDSTKSGRHHTRRTSSRSGFHDLPPGSYGLHGHGVESTDKLEKAYYEKHPEKYRMEHYQPLHDRGRDYSMSRENLNKIVRDTASRGVGFGTSEHIGTPSEQTGFQASDEYTSRMSSPQPSPAVPKPDSIKSPVKSDFSGPGDEKGSSVIHVDDFKEFVKCGHERAPQGNDGTWPILAADEVAKHTPAYELQPAVVPNYPGSGGAGSRPSSRPASVVSPPPPEAHSTPLDDVEEYEPLFPEDEKGDQKPKTAADKLKEYQRFPSQDIWEDAPNSVHSTAEVSTPELADARPKSRSTSVDLPPRDAETPAQAFARRQEALAEKEAVTPDSFLNRQQRPKSWVEHQPHLTKEIPTRPKMAPRFPSRDIWEDTPDSLQFTTTVSKPESVDDSTNDDPSAPASRPVAPVRPPKKQGSGDDNLSKPTIPNRPKPQIPARPLKSAVDSKEPDGTAKQKPVVPARPARRLLRRTRLPRKKAPDEKEKAPLADARKGRARGPQRRAPTKSHGPGSGAEKSIPPSMSNGHPVLSFSMTRTLWSIDEEGTVTVDDLGPEKSGAPESMIKEVKPKEPEVQEAKAAERETDQAQAEEAETVETKTEETKTEEAKAEEAKAEEAKAEEKKVEETKVEDASEKELEKTTGESDVTTNDKPSEDRVTVEETKPLVTNIAGESILAETIKKNEDSDEVKEVEEKKDELIL